MSVLVSQKADVLLANLANGHDRHGGGECCEETDAGGGH